MVAVAVNINRQFQDFVDGTLDTGVDSVTTTVSGSFLSALPAIATGAIMTLVLDPEASAGVPEKVWVVAHTALATTATVVRGVEGSVARAHSSGVRVVGALTSEALPRGVIAYAYDSDHPDSSPADIFPLSVAVTVPENRILRITGAALPRVMGVAAGTWLKIGHYITGMNVLPDGDEMKAYSVISGIGAHWSLSYSVLALPVAGTHTYSYHVDAEAVSASSDFYIATIDNNDSPRLTVEDMGGYSG